jgi:hypothetical protein
MISIAHRESEDRLQAAARQASRDRQKAKKKKKKKKKKKTLISERSSPAKLLAD